MGLREGITEYLKKQWDDAKEAYDADDIAYSKYEHFAQNTIIYKQWKREKERKPNKMEVSKYMHDKVNRTNTVSFEFLWEIMYGNGLRISKKEIIDTYNALINCEYKSVEKCLVPVMYSPLCGCSVWIVGRKYYNLTDLPKVMFAIFEPNREPGEPIIFDGQEGPIGHEDKYIECAREYGDRANEYYEKIAEFFEERCMKAKKDFLGKANPVRPKGVPEVLYGLFGAEEDIGEDVKKQKQRDEKYYKKQEAR